MMCQVQYFISMIDRSTDVESRDFNIQSELSVLAVSLNFPRKMFMQVY